jgi:hypothetical protein
MQGRIIVIVQPLKDGGIDRGLLLRGTVTTPANIRIIVETISDRVIKQINGLDTVGIIPGRILAIIFVT